jgi:hypothetical protein
MASLPAKRGSLTLSNFDHSLNDRAKSFDLSNLQFVDAYGVVGSACALLAALDDGAHPTIRMPSQEQVRAHLALIGVRGLLEQLDYKPELPKNVPPHRPDVLVL